MIKHVLYGDFNSVEEYLLYIQCVGGFVEDGSAVAAFTSLSSEFGTFLGEVDKDADLSYGDEDVDLYAIGGLNSLDVWGSHKEKMEFYKDKALLLKRIRSV